jgi:hypothetical protein
MEWGFGQRLIQESDFTGIAPSAFHQRFAIAERGGRRSTDDRNTTRADAAEHDDSYRARTTFAKR